MNSSSSSKPTRAAQARRQAFDPWVPVAAGHQIAETPTGVQWRAARNKKLAGQFGGGGSGREHVGSLGPGPGAQHDDAALVAGATATPDAQAQEGRSVREMLMEPGLMTKHPGAKVGAAITTTTTTTTTTTAAATTHLAGAPPAAEADSRDDKPSPPPSSSLLASSIKTSLSTDAQEARDGTDAPAAAGTKKKIFDGVTVYVNGSTYPLVSDHQLKHLIAEHGGAVSLHLGRRSVTHVIVGRPVARGGAGGGLAGGKLESEIRKRRGLGVKFVGVEW